MKKVRKLSVYERVTLLNAITHLRRDFENERNNHAKILTEWEIDVEIEKLNNVENLLLKMYVEE